MRTCSSRRIASIKPLTEVYRSTLPYTLLLLATVLLITYVPWMTLWLVRLVFGGA